ncbi:MAG: hypothetical protein EOO05_20060, partial [Chitinophagaceae bacterium]
MPVYIVSNQLLRIFLFTVMVAILAIPSSAQRRDSFDTAYYKTYPRQVTGRIFFSQKYTRVNL